MQAEPQATLAAFEAARPAMFGMAYRMLGTHADAEDVLQDVFLRWSKADRGVILNPAVDRHVTVLRPGAYGLCGTVAARTTGRYDGERA